MSADSKDGSEGMEGDRGPVDAKDADPREPGTERYEAARAVVEAAVAFNAACQQAERLELDVDAEVLDAVAFPGHREATRIAVAVRERIAETVGIDGTPAVYTGP